MRPGVGFGWEVVGSPSDALGLAQMGSHAVECERNGVIAYLLQARPTRALLKDLLLDLAESAV